MSAPVLDLSDHPRRRTASTAPAAPDRSVGAGPLGGRPLRVIPIPAHEPAPTRLGREPSRPLTLVRTAPGDRQLALPLRTSSVAAGADPVFGPQLTVRGDLPDPALWSRRLLQAILEALSGRRSPAQVQSWTSIPVYRDIARTAQRALRTRSRSTREEGVFIRGMRVCEPADGIAEVCAVVRRDGRWQAVAARLEGLDGSWRCVALSVG